MVSPKNIGSVLLATVNRKAYRVIACIVACCYLVPAIFNCIGLGKCGSNCSEEMVAAAFAARVVQQNPGFVESDDHFEDSMIGQTVVTMITSVTIFLWACCPVIKKTWYMFVIVVIMSFAQFVMYFWYGIDYFEYYSNYKGSAWGDTVAQLFTGCAYVTQPFDDWNVKKCLELTDGLEGLYAVYCASHLNVVIFFVTIFWTVGEIALIVLGTKKALQVDSGRVPLTQNDRDDTGDIYTDRS